MRAPASSHGRFFSRILRTAAAGTIVALSACSSGGGANAPAVPAAATAKPTGTAHFTLTIPTRTVPASQRRAQYVSASTAAVLFTVTPGNLQTKLNLTASNCTANASATAELCTLAVQAPIGNDTFAMVAYDKPFNVDGTQPGGTSALSAASNFTVNITEGQPNVAVPLIAGGIPSTLSLSIGSGSSTTLTGGAASTIPVTVTVYDADGNIIVAPGSYVNASGTATPVTITSQAATTGFGYAVTPAGSTVAGASGATITLNEPDDSVALAYNGTAYVPATDTLTHTVPSHVGGATTTQFTYGWHFTPPFTPALLLAPPASISGSIGHNGIVIANRTNEVGFVGDVMTSCTVPSISAGSVTRIGGMTFNSGTSDTHVYLWLNDTGQNYGVGFDEISVASIASNSCGVVGSAAGQIGSGSTTQAVAAAGNDLYAVETISGADFLEEFSLPSLSEATQGIIDGGTSFGIASLGIAPGGGSAYPQFGAKKRVDSTTFGSTGGSQFALAGLTDSYPGGVTVDTSGNIYANDTSTAIYGTNGGVDVLTSGFAVTSHVYLGSPLLQTGPSGALQNLAVGPYGGSSALYAVTAAGIEVFAFPFGAFVNTPTETIATPSTPVSIVTAQDGREWVLLSDGTLDALPPN